MLIGAREGRKKKKLSKQHRGLSSPRPLLLFSLPAASARPLQGLLPGPHSNALVDLCAMRDHWPRTNPNQRQGNRLQKVDAPFARKKQKPDLTLLLRPPLSLSPPLPLPLPLPLPPFNLASPPFPKKRSSSSAPSSRSSASPTPTPTPSPSASATRACPIARPGLPASAPGPGGSTLARRSSRCPGCSVTSTPASASSTASSSRL